MLQGSRSVVRMRRAFVLGSVLAGLWVAPPAQAQDDPSVLLYTGTTGFRHSDGINNGRPVVQNALAGLGYTVDWEDCDGNGGGANNCDHPDKNPRIFTTANLAQYDAIVFLNASWSWAGGQRPGPLLGDAQKNAVIEFVRNGGGIAAVHNSTDMGAGTSVWDWWDGGPNSVVGSTMPGHSANNINATVMTQDHNHLATRDLPDTWSISDEHYNWARNVRGTHHVLANFDERTYNPGSNAMGQDHPITWCKLYDGDNVNDGTATPKSYSDGRTWLTGIGHNGARYTENGGDNNLVKMIVGGIRWVAGEGRKSDCSGTVWSSFTRTVLVPDARAPIGIDVAKDGKVYWSEIGSVGFQSEGQIMMHDPSGAAGNKTVVGTIPTRADHGNSEDGVLGMSLEPGFDLADPAKRDVFVYYSPRPGAGDNWPTTGNEQVVGYNQVSRFTLDEDGTAVVPGSERVILRVPKAKIAGSPSGFPGGPTDSGPGHVGGAGLDFDSEGSLYLGVGDDVSPNASGHNRYPPMDYRAAERWDARKTSANSADLRGKIVRITPRDEIAAGTAPGVGQTYDIPAGNMFAPGTANTRPEIYAMGFRQPFTIHTDPANPGTVTVGEFCHDNNANQADRAPAGVCEWNLVKQPGFHGWPFCVGDNSALNSSWRWNYAANSSTNSQYDCSLSSLPSDLNWAPTGQTAAPPTFPGLENLPGPAVPATIWKKYPNAAGGQNPADFGDLSAGGMQPVTGPVYRYDAETAGAGAFPPYYDGSWIINNRGSNEGFWKEVRLREADNNMLHVHDWLPYNAAGTDPGSLNGLVIGTQFGPDGALYMSRFAVGCCRNQVDSQAVQIVKISFNVTDQCEADTQPPNVSHEVTGRPYPNEPDTYIDSASLRLSAADVGCAGTDTIEYRLTGATEWQPYDGPVTFDDAGDYSVEYRATDRMDNVSAIRTATFTVQEVDDSAAPVTTATLDPAAPGPGGTYNRAVNVNLSATDAGIGVDVTEYRVDGGAWQTAENTGGADPFTTSVAVTDSGEHTVEYRSIDLVENAEDVKSVSFTIDLPECERSDEFDGALDERWLRHERNGGTPTTGPMAPRVEGGQLILPTHDFELDAASATTSVGPVNFVGQDLPALGDAWQVETQFTVTHTGGWQGVGLMLWQADNNFFRSSITHSLTGGNIYVEQSKDNPTSAEGQRQQAGGNVTILPAKGPVTIRMRYTRAAGSNTVAAQYQVVAPESAANDDWVNFPGAANFLNLDTGASTPRRDSAGSRVGIYAGGNFPGSTGTHPYPGTPADVKVDYFRITPDVCPEPDETAPTTSALLNGAPPASTYDGPVDVTLSATDEPADADPFLGSATRALAGALAEHQVDAEGTAWDPTEVDAALGDVVTWNFPAETAGFPHDVWVIAPDEAPDSAGTQVTPGPVNPGGPSVSFTPDQAGSWTYVCKLHSFVSGGQWSGMVGTIDVTDSGPGPEPEVSGVDYTERRVDGGDWVRSDNDGDEDPFVTEFSVTGTGDHSVEYRSVDVAGNVENVKQVVFAIGDGPGDPDAPTVEGFANPRTGAAPLLVALSASGHDPQGGELTYEWDFGDGGGSFNQSVAHTYAQPGEYTATVTVTDEQGKTGSDTVEILVSEEGNQAPTVRATADRRSGDAPLTVAFSAQASDPDGPAGAITYLWDFGDGGADAFGRNASYTYLEPGSYTATVTATDGAGAFDTAEIEIVVEDPPGNVAPEIRVAAAPRSGTAPLQVSFTSLASDPDGDRLTTPVWDFGEPGDDDRMAGDSATWTYRQPGSYTATATVRDPDGLTHTASVQITVNPQASGRAPQGAPPQGSPPPAPVGDEQTPARPQITAKRTQKVRSVIRRGLRLRIACTQDCRVRSILRLSGRRVGASKRLAIEAGHTRTVTIRLNRNIRRNLIAAMRQAGVRRLTATATTTITDDQNTRAYPTRIRLRR